MASKKNSSKKTKKKRTRSAPEAIPQAAAAEESSPAKPAKPKAAEPKRPARSADSSNQPAESLVSRLAFYFSGLIIALTPFAIYLPLGTPSRGQSYFLKIFVPIAFAVVAILSLARPPERLRISLPWLALALNAVAMLVSSLLSPVPAHSIEVSFLWYSGIMLFALFGFAASGKRSLTSVIPWVLVMQGGVLALYGILQYFRIEFLAYSSNVPKNRIIATFGHPNFFASFIGPVLFISAAQIIRARTKVSRLVALGACALMAIALLMARSRAVWIGSTIGLVIAGVLIYRHQKDLLTRAWKRPMIKILVACCAVVIAAGALYVGPSAIKRLARLDPGTQWENRIYYWTVALELRPAFSPIGIGEGGFAREFWSASEAFQQTSEGALFRRNLVAMTGRSGAIDPGHVHNEYLEMLAESGPFALLGLMAFVLYIAIYFPALLKQIRGTLTDEFTLPAASLMFGGWVCMLFDALLGFPLALPASMVIFFYLSATLHQFIQRGEL